MLRIGSCFAGIGGLELGLEGAGLGPVIWQIEIDDVCQSVLAKHWPDAMRFDDIRSVRATDLAPVDLMCGGFPCTDVSSSGKRQGMYRGPHSSLWFAMLDLVRVLRPEFVVVENVASGARKWLALVGQGLRLAGYRCVALPVAASDVGAPHRRKRIFVVGRLADADRERREAEWRRRVLHGGTALGNHVDGCGAAEFNKREDTRVADTDRNDLRIEPRWSGGSYGIGAAQPGQSCDDRRSSGTATQSEVCPPTDGFPRRVARWPAARGEPQHLWEAARTIPKEERLTMAKEGLSANEQLKVLGNAVVPACAEVVGRFVRDWLLPSDVALT